MRSAPVCKPKEVRHAEPRRFVFNPPHDCPPHRRGVRIGRFCIGPVFDNNILDARAKSHFNRSFEFSWGADN